MAVILLALFGDIMHVVPTTNHHQFHIVGSTETAIITNDWHNPLGSAMIQLPASVWGYGPGDIIVETSTFTAIAPFQTELQRMLPLFRFFDAQGNVDLFAFFPRLYEIDLAAMMISLPLENRGPLPLNVTYHSVPEPTTMLLVAIAIIVNQRLRETGKFECIYLMESAQRR